MPSFETPADIFTRLSVFDSPKGSSYTFKTHKNISLYFKRRYLIISNYLKSELLIQIATEEVLIISNMKMGQNFGAISLSESHFVKSERPLIIT